MTLPPWHPKTDEERHAFIELVHEELMTARMKEGQANIGLLDDLVFGMEARKRGYEQSTKKRGPRFTADRSSALAQAKEDALRMPAIFRRVWGKRNRHSAPTRADIAAEIWQLDDREKAELSDFLDHK